MRLVIMESPYKGLDWIQRWKNRRYARKCLKDCLMRGDAPMASHLLYTQVLRDWFPKERNTGIRAGLEWVRVADATVVYTDRGISGGMMQGIIRAMLAGKPVEYRTLLVW